MNAVACFVRNAGLILLASFSCIGASRATPNVGLSISSFVDVNGTVITFNHSNQPGPTFSTDLSLGTAPGPQATVNGTVAFGTITGSLSMTSTGAQANGDFFGVWEDGATVSSSSLPLGTPVQLLATMINHVSVSCSGPHGSASATAAFNPTNTVPQLLVSTSQCGSALPTISQETFSSVVGAVLVMEGQLHISGSASLGSSAAVDPPESFFIDPITPDVSLVSLSGHNYLTPVASVPEPGTAALMFGGFVALAGLARRRLR